MFLFQKSKDICNLSHDGRCAMFIAIEMRVWFEGGLRPRDNYSE